MADEQGGMVRFTRLRREYLGDGAFRLDQGDDFWIPERSFTVTPRVHQQPEGEELTYSLVTILDTNEKVEALETTATVIDRQTAALERTRPTGGTTDPL